MASAKKAIPNILRWEGGYSSHSADTDGGCTMKGITLITFRRYYGKGKTCDDLKRITDDQWYHIFRAGYWDRLNGDKIENQSIADLCVDMCWGSGTVTAIAERARQGGNPRKTQGNETVMVYEHRTGKPKKEGFFIWVASEIEYFCI